MKTVWYNKETGEVCEGLRQAVRLAWLNWKYYRVKPIGWRTVKLVK